MSYRTIGFLVGGFLAGILVGWAVLGLAPGPSPRPASQPTPASRPTPPASQPTSPASQSAPPPSQTTPTNQPTPLTSQPSAGDPSEVARQKLLAGRLEEAQNDYLQLLLSGPYRNDPRVLQVLATIRRRLAHDDPALLRRQATGYRKAIAQNVETEQHYTPEAMELLAQASLIAANELEGQTSAKTQPPGSVAAVQPSPTSEGPKAAAPLPTPQPGSSSQRPSNSGKRPTRKPTPTVTPKKNPTPPPTTRAAAPPGATATPEAPTSTSQAPSPTPTPALRDVNAPLYIVQVGPISEAERAKATGIAGVLTNAGFASQVSRRSEPELYRVLSDPLAPAAAERRASFLAQHGLQTSVRSLGGGPVQLDFGGFASREAAEALRRRVSSLGYGAQVTREGGTIYTITLGPHPQAGVDTIVKIMRSQFPAEIRVTVVRAPRPPSEQSAGK